jgi:hypothetical protein
MYQWHIQSFTYQFECIMSRQLLLLIAMGDGNGPHQSISSKLLAIIEEILTYKLLLIELSSFWLALSFVYFLK